MIKKGRAGDMALEVFFVGRCWLGGATEAKPGVSRCVLDGETYRFRWWDLCGNGCRRWR